MGMVGFTVALMVIGVIISPCVHGNEFSDHKEIEVERLLKRLNKHALISIKSEDGDIIDCVPIHSQLAFDHPLLKNHNIQMRPNIIRESTSTYTKNYINVTQAWHKKGICPENTVSIRRIKKEDILRSNFIENFGKKMTPGILLYGSSSVHEYAVMNCKKGKYFGTKFAVNIWKPKVQVPNEFSLAQTWLSSGVGTNLNTIEAGFQVLPSLYGDNNLRLFVYWTADNYQKTGCYNTNCPGFVQTSNRITVGGTFKSVSKYDGIQIAVLVMIWKDGDYWWLQINKELVGYWPAKLFSSLGKGATEVLWGGEIVNEKTGGKHTSTDMGSGHFADEGHRKASYFRNIMTVDKTNTLREPQGVYPTVTNDNCYNIKEGRNGTSWGFNFFYGGPGLNAKCP
ncbi:unnamed protein product [Brassica oleracea var. botrytis]|uniref:Neprosin PEP catalytic domain-containing protein n=4 Tax=Brassica oleracea TaxID=3712 RepID=A0A0D3BPR0_BRAOL|nr:PREDICTED: uncharacterized protein LOC106341026 [Brassica oleracea var. oleracea]VDD04707.1 unnamed protein product [Brassica oleracea]